MEEGAIVAVWASAAGGIIFIILFVVVVLLTRLTKHKKDGNRSFLTIKYEKIPILKRIPVKIQLPSRNKSQHESVDLPDTTSEVSKPVQEKSSEPTEVDPLFAVLTASTSRITTATTITTTTTTTPSTTKSLHIDQPEEHVKQVADEHGSAIKAESLEEDKKTTDDTPTKDGIQVELALVWASNDQSLSIMVVQINQLNHRPSELFFQLGLESTNKFSKGDMDIEEKKHYSAKKPAAFCFKGVTLEDVHQCYLKMELTEKKSWYSKETSLARGILPLKKIILVPNKPLKITANLTLTIEQEPCKEVVDEDSGTVTISIKCCFVGQLSAKFIVEIKKAEKLPTMKIGGDFKAEVFLMRNESRILFFSTSLKGGSTPDWNESFAFDISRNNLSEYSLEITIVRIGVWMGMSRVAETSLCNVGIRSIIVYWIDAIENIGQEILITRGLKTCRHEVVGSNSDKTIGLLAVCLEQTQPPTRWIHEAKFEATFKTVAKFEYEKSGGDYKVEAFARQRDKVLENFTSATAPASHIVWNARFAFTVSENVMQDLNITLNLIRMGRISKGLPVAHLYVGNAHFAECQEAPRTIIEKWYPLHRTIQPDVL